MEKKEYCSPQMEIIKLSYRDVITESELGGGIIVTPEDEF